ncbi:hypothetical protein H072_6673 [Dactylellina haptotyla CBS 200.50]|uniref:C2H2-type domain-containing protein n=1 Tax=Dactylellina haptotyla (strain CBS 200.50) TaxID=1284197 RepID=S8A978_DACHA|nr:hypothetical protein H072_6673 [Dactylellina haptotyla CBS 200.50]
MDFHPPDPGYGTDGTTREYVPSNCLDNGDGILSDYIIPGDYESPIFGQSQNSGQASPDRDPGPSSYPADHSAPPGPLDRTSEPSYASNSSNTDYINPTVTPASHGRTRRGRRHNSETEHRDDDTIAGNSTPLSSSLPLSPSEGFGKLGINSPPSSSPELQRKYHVCYLCDEQFSALKAYGTHMWHDHNLKEFPCPKCKVKFARDDYVKTHLKVGKCPGPLQVGKRQASTSPKSSIGAQRESKRPVLVRYRYSDTGPIMDSPSFPFLAASPSSPSSMSMPTPTSTIASGPIPVAPFESFFDPRPRSGNHERLALPVLSQPAPQSLPLSQHERHRGLPPVGSRNRGMIAPADFAKSERTIEQLRMTVKALQTSNDMTIATLNAENADLKAENEGLKAKIRRLEYAVQYHHSL